MTTSIAVVDCHAHLTAVPPSAEAFGEELGRTTTRKGVMRSAPRIADDELAASVAQLLATQRTRSVSHTLLSPRAASMGHGWLGESQCRRWTAYCNDLVARIVDMFPDELRGVCALPQSPGSALRQSVAELRRCVSAGFVGCLLDPDPSSGFWSGQHLGSKCWNPIWEVLCELDVPAMVHATTSCNPSFHTTASHYLVADVNAFVQLVSSDVFERFPRLRVVIPHGGGVVPYQWPRLEAIARREGWRPLGSTFENVYFDTCLYGESSMRLLVDVVPSSNLLFGSELLGAVRDFGPDGDDTLQWIRAVIPPGAARDAVLGENARRVFPRISRRPGAAPG